jgi:crotonobetainyl-CoA:carnitine CoA-transferase CaiB-like acyl-CoA transferase
VLVNYFYRGVIARRREIFTGIIPSVPSCRDGYILLSLFLQWETLVEWLDSEDMADDLGDEKWQDETGRQANIDHIIKVLEKWTQKHTVNELVEQGQLMHFPGLSLYLPDCQQSPAKRRGFFCRGAGPADRKALYVSRRLSKMSASQWRASPDLPIFGNYNRKIYAMKSA